MKKVITTLRLLLLTPMALAGPIQWNEYSQYQQTYQQSNISPVLQWQLQQWQTQWQTQSQWNWQSQWQWNYEYSHNQSTTSVPEPSSLFLMVFGLLSLAFLRKHVAQYQSH